MTFEEGGTFNSINDTTLEESKVNNSNDDIKKDRGEQNKVNTSL